MKEYKPPFNIRTVDLHQKSIFLAGSIEMGKAINWQQEIVELLKDDEGIILNPRRDDWDASWEQKMTNPQFREQVEWELYGLENASLILVYFQPNTMSPITLMELGLHLKQRSILVCCPEGYERKGNVDITCAMYGVPVIDDFETLKETLKTIVAP